MYSMFKSTSTTSRYNNAWTVNRSFSLIFQPIGNRRLLLEFEPPGRTIVDKAVEESVDFIVIGARGLGKVRRTILGSVSDYIVHHSKVPVTVVPPESWRHHYPHRYPTNTDTDVKETVI